MHSWDKPKPAAKITKPGLQTKQNETWATTQKGAGLEMDQHVPVKLRKKEILQQ